LILGWVVDVNIGFLSIQIGAAHSAQNAPEDVHVTGHRSRGWLTIGAMKLQAQLDRLSDAGR
jgi:hypothetical protein